MSDKIFKIYDKYKEFINYIIIGCFTTLISLGTYYALVFTILNANNAFELQIANVLSWLFAVTFAFFTNKTIVFKSKDKNIIKEITKFYTVRLSTLFLDMLIMHIGVMILSIDDKIMKIVVQIIIMITNYILSKIFVFVKGD